ncbi:MAG: HD-GYP domain-containing protein [Candidatus Eremiobacteraeota bacterium]|nr:HD-GYP domain-containing protein [Candidatus Eremiobacteraeota bacterium]
MRFSFVTRFTLVTALASISVALILSFVLTAAHARSVQNDLIANAIGQASALLTPAMGKLDPKTHRSGDAIAQIAQAASQITSFQQFVSGMRVYWPDGKAIYPLGAAQSVAGVSRALGLQQVYRAPSQQVDGQESFTAYSPLGNPAGNDYVAVVALDFSPGQMASQTLGERRFVIGSTVGACALIFLSLLALALAAQRELNRRQRLADDTFTQTMSGLATIVDKRDPYTAGHSLRVAAYAKRLAQSMRLDRALIKTIENAALLHDLGKIGIPDAVLLKPARFDDRERSIIKFHPEIAGEILAGVEAMCEVIPCIVHHHERWDGAGYPQQLSAENIPLGARIISVADAYDAMTTDRPYRRALSVEVARAELLRVGGTQFDQNCVCAFIDLIDAGEVVPPPPLSETVSLDGMFGAQLPSLKAPV